MAASNFYQCIFSNPVSLASHIIICHRIRDSRQFSAPATGYFFDTTDDYKLHPFSLCSLPVLVPFNSDKRHERDGLMPGLLSEVIPPKLSLCRFLPQCVVWNDFPPTRAVVCCWLLRVPVTIITLTPLNLSRYCVWNILVGVCLLGVWLMTSRSQYYIKPAMHTTTPLYILLLFSVSLIILTKMNWWYMIFFLH